MSSPEAALWEMSASKELEDLELVLQAGIQASGEQNVRTGVQGWGLITGTSD